MGLRVAMRLIVVFNNCQTMTLLESWSDFFIRSVSTTRIQHTGPREACCDGLQLPQSSRLGRSRAPAVRHANSPASGMDQGCMLPGLILELHRTHALAITCSGKISAARCHGRSSLKCEAGGAHEAAYMCDFLPCLLRSENDSHQPRAFVTRLLLAEIF